MPLGRWGRKAQTRVAWLGSRLLLRTAGGGNGQVGWGVVREGVESGPGLTLDPSQADQVVSEGKQTRKESEMGSPEAAPSLPGPTSSLSGGTDSSDTFPSVLQWSGA